MTSAVCTYMSSGMCVEDMSSVFVLQGFVNKSSITAVCLSVHIEQQQTQGWMHRVYTQLKEQDLKANKA